MGSDLSLLYLLREPKQVFMRLSSNIIKLGKMWDIQLLILPCPAFTGQEFKAKRAVTAFWAFNLSIWWWTEIVQNLLYLKNKYQKFNFNLSLQLVHKTRLPPGRKPKHEPLITQYRSRTGKYQYSHSRQSQTVTLRTGFKSKKRKEKVWQAFILTTPSPPPLPTSFLKLWKHYVNKQQIIC